jgi:hypothetical protein
MKIGDRYRYGTNQNGFVCEVLEIIDLYYAKIKIVQNCNWGLTVGSEYLKECLSSYTLLEGQEKSQNT